MQNIFRTKPINIGRADGSFWTILALGLINVFSSIGKVERLGMIHLMSVSDGTAAGRI